NAPNRRYAGPKSGETRVASRKRSMAASVSPADSSSIPSEYAAGSDALLPCAPSAPGHAVASAAATTANRTARRHVPIQTIAKDPNDEKSDDGSVPHPFDARPNRDVAGCLPLLDPFPRRTRTPPPA